MLGLVNTYFMFSYSDQPINKTKYFRSVSDFNNNKQSDVDTPTLLHINPIFFLVLLVMEVGIVLIDI
jgi:hypothetical protein